MTFFHTLLTAVALLTAPFAHAATVTLGGDATMNCGLTLEGVITQGDADKIAGLARELPDGIAGMYRKERLCLNSPGGSYPEGVAIAKRLRQIGIGTAVAEGARCESACAIAFMGGTMHGEEGQNSVHRVLHPRGKLGFHAPSVDVPEREYTKQAVDRSFQIALDAIASLMQARAEGLDFAQSLMIAMIGTPPDQMRYVETTGEASRWEIAIFPIALPDLPPEKLAATACGTGSVTIYDGAPSPNMYTDVSRSFLTRTALSDYAITLLTSRQYMIEATARCELTLPYNPVFASGRVGYFRFTGDRDESLHNLYRHMFYPADTRLTALTPDPSGPQTDLALLRQKIETAPPVPPTELFRSCTLQGQRAAIANVQNFVNLRASASLKAPIVRELPFGTEVTLTGDPVVGREWAGQAQRCIDLCNRWSANRRDAAHVRSAAQCVADNVVWYPIRDAAGNAGYVSRKYLEESW
ncbi:SH3 domain-containing protein [Tropicibacter naphthalenivorans]|uniref:Uncharacterized protein n=1 Tax=Tropicibacter naphthalenivorans TaxID=441103 RepID=A0A0P1G053_9RHOB|nr:SH3 domain-containing protein [Tropicibacter naphthalenivorans]CUH75020.1 hypothetical protein TRN7648_00210 [Tropicibacter naphthalenivorans]SMC47302.1 hypothetical protein SAMN04488093_101670 [Tropicibacter naphthalenivorans]